MDVEQLRAACHEILNQMPEDGLEETLATLRDYLTFYTDRRAAQARAAVVVDG